jgi:hypothetical protein
MIQKSQKPIDIDAHFKYRCINPKCDIVHWISFKEAKTSNYKIVCDCDTIFIPKQIKTLNIEYVLSTKKEQTDCSNQTVKNIEYKPKNNKELEENISEETLKKSISLLSKTGFTTQESYQLVKKYYSICKIDNYRLLVKYILDTISGENNE